MIAAVLAETHRDQKRKPEPFSPLDFMPLQKHLAARLRREGGSDLELVERFRSLSRSAKPKEKDKA